MDSDDSKRLLMELMMRDNLSGAESRELVGKAIKMISDWKNDLIEPDKAMETLDDPEDMILRPCMRFMSVTCVRIMPSILMT